MTHQSLFPYFGGKSKVADLVWSRFGDVGNYVEPFFGSGAVLFMCPTPMRVASVNDADQFVANFWRAVQSDPEAVAHHVDWPVNEADLHARHYWLVTEGVKQLVTGLTDPDWFDAKIAGWWCWGLCCWIGSGWCSGKGPWAPGPEGWGRQDGPGINRQLPHLGNAGLGINRKLPHLGNAGLGINRPNQDKLALIQWFAERLRNVRVACGDWSRVCGPSVTERLGLTAVFLDPPYADTATRHKDCYRTDSLSVAHAVREWAIANGANPLLRIALCGYAGEHAMPNDWECLEWKAKGGYGSQGHGQGRINAGRERIWFSPHCLKPTRGLI